MAKRKKTDLDIVKKAESEANKNPVSHLQVHTVEPVTKIKDKGNKPKGETRDGKKKARQKPVGKTNGRAIKKSEKKPDTGEKSPIPVPRRRRTLDEILEGILPPWF